MKRILFVDDEQRVLDGLRNLLRGRRHEWDMRFACGGEAAFACLAAEQFDVVITDMRMPQIDGARVLNHVRSTQPQAVRIVLSGQTDTETAMKTVLVAHRFLSKPCEARLLKTFITRACQLQTLFNDPALRRTIGEIGSLPAIPATFVKLTAILSRPISSMKDIAHVVEQDMALAAKILQLVNSAFFGLPQKVSNIEDAVKYLGATTIRSLTLGLEAFPSGASNRASPALARHSLLTAHLARRFFPKDRLRADEAFLAGLLHNIGRLVTAPKAEVGGSGISVPHNVCGAYLLSLWGFPHVITEAVLHHLDPARVEHSGFDVMDAVYLANQLAGGGDAPLDTAYLEAQGVPAAQLAQWMLLADQMAAPRQEAGGSAPSP